MLTQPLAKINIGLHIVGKRPDGYHDLETIFYPIPLHDTLETQVLPFGASLLFETVGINIPGNADDNLVVKVYRQMQQEFNLPPVRIKLHKRIPIGAGLGGGSSDAAEMMKQLNAIFRLGLSANEMEQRMSAFGADCPFFIRCHPVYATGIGNVFHPILLNMKGLNLVLVKPNIHVSTAQAYAGVKVKSPATDLRAVAAIPVELWKDRLVNDFEDGVFAQFPVIAAIKQRLYDLGVLYAAMSGSGSAVFALSRQAIPELQSHFPDSFTYQSML